MKKLTQSQQIPIKITPENKCSFCKGSKCCQYITQHIDGPRSIVDFDTLLWQVSHQNIHLYKDSTGWYLLINNQCVHLQKDGRCGIYEKRPFICRDYSNHSCEFDKETAEGCDLYFDGYESLDNYCRKRFKNWDNRFNKR